MSKYKDPRWQQLRLRCFDRDGWACVACGDKTTTLHAHHKRYTGANPWNSPLEDLQTLCETCHEALGEHPKGGVYYIAHGYPAGKTYPAKTYVTVQYDHCPQCGGTSAKDKDTFSKCWDCSAYMGPIEGDVAVGWNFNGVRDLTYEEYLVKSGQVILANGKTRNPEKYLDRRFISKEIGYRYVEIDREPWMLDEEETP